LPTAVKLPEPRSLPVRDLSGIDIVPVADIVTRHVAADDPLRCRAIHVACGSRRCSITDDTG
jgi:hypothetical protein